MKELDEQHLSLVLTQQDKNRSKQIDLFKKANSTVSHKTQLRTMQMQSIRLS